MSLRDDPAIQELLRIKGELPSSPADRALAIAKDKAQAFIPKEAAQAPPKQSPSLALSYQWPAKPEPSEQEPDPANVVQYAANNPPEEGHDRESLIQAMQERMKGHAESAEQMNQRLAAGEKFYGMTGASSSAKSRMHTAGLLGTAGGLAGGAAGGLAGGAIGGLTGLVRPNIGIGQGVHAGTGLGGGLGALAGAGIGGLVGALHKPRLATPENLALRRAEADPEFVRKHMGAAIDDDPSQWFTSKNAAWTPGLARAAEAGVGGLAGAGIGALAGGEDHRLGGALAGGTLGAGAALGGSHLLRAKRLAPYHQAAEESAQAVSDFGHALGDVRKTMAEQHGSDIADAAKYKAHFLGLALEGGGTRVFSPRVAEAGQYHERLGNLASLAHDDIRAAKRGLASRPFGIGARARNPRVSEVVHKVEGVHPGATQSREEIEAFMGRTKKAALATAINSYLEERSRGEEAETLMQQADLERQQKQVQVQQQQQMMQQQQQISLQQQQMMQQQQQMIQQAMQQQQMAVGGMPPEAGMPPEEMPPEEQQMPPEQEQAPAAAPSQPQEGMAA